MRQSSLMSPPPALQLRYKSQQEASTKQQILHVDMLQVELTARATECASLERRLLMLQSQHDELQVSMM